MCGIAGFLTPRALEHDLAGLAGQMALCLAHRGPDDHGAWADDAAGVALGFRRLSIIDLSEHGHQPMMSATGRFAIVLNGEIYNFPELRSALEREGMRFRGHSDIEVALGVIERDGIAAALPQFNGMFALALWDRQTRTLYLARDRFGEKPLYYGLSRGVLLFGSELKALRRHPAFDAQIDHDALEQFFRFGYIPAPLSIYAGIRKLPAASVVTASVSDGALTLGAPQVYWSHAQVVSDGLAKPFGGSDDEALDGLDRVLRAAVGRRMMSDVPLGAFLSGGIDSSMIVAQMQAQSAAPVRTFTIGFEAAGYDEASDARAVAAVLGTDHTEMVVRPAEAQAVIPRLPQLYDEPFADSSQIPTSLVSSLARRHVTVALSGDGGDELFGGYNRYVWGSRISRVTSSTPAGLRRTLSRALRARSTDSWTRTIERVGWMVPAGLRVRHPGEKLHKLAAILETGTPEAMYRALVSIWPEPERVVAGAPRRSHAYPVMPVGLNDVRDWMMYCDSVTYLSDDILAKVDRASMATSLEARVPMLDPEVYAYAWRLPRGMKIRHGQGKWLLRRLLARYVPPSLFERPKMGFAVPIGEWLRGPLRAWADDLLDEQTLRREGLLDADMISAMWTQHRAGKANWQYHLWTVLMFQAWHAGIGSGVQGDGRPPRTPEPTPLGS